MDRERSCRYLYSLFEVLFIVYRGKITSITLARSQTASIQPSDGQGVGVGAWGLAVPMILDLDPLRSLLKGSVDHPRPRFMSRHLALSFIDLYEYMLPLSSCP